MPLTTVKSPYEMMIFSLVKFAGSPSPKAPRWSWMVTPLGSLGVWSAGIALKKTW